MNKRIFKLALKAMDFQGAVDTDTELKLTNSELAKFAELIVREFSKQVQIEGRFGLERDQTLIRLCCENAKKHFGVEE
jgi:hypothetical protein